MENYKLAIIIPSWNCSKYIAEMLDSIIANTFTDWKCFIVDDQSTDNSLDIINRYISQDKRICCKIRDREPKGAQTCRNIGFELSEGSEYVIWFDADDIIAPYCLEQRVNYLDRHPELDFGIFPAKLFKNDPSEYNIDVWGYDYLNDTLRCFLNRTLMLVGWTNIYRRETILRKNLSWDEKILSLQDADWNIQAICAGLKFGYAAKENALNDYYHRSVNNGITSKIFSTEHCKSHLYHIDKTLKSLNKEQLAKYEKDISGCLLRFALLFYSYDKKQFLQLLNIDWVKEHWWYRTRLLALFVLRGKGCSKILKDEWNYHQRVKKDWWLFKKLMYENAIHQNSLMLQK